MKVLVVSDMYYRPERAISATFVHRQMVELGRLGVEARVIDPVAVLPGGFRWDLRGRARGSRVVLDGVPVERVTYPKLLPFGVSPGLGVRLMARRLTEAVARTRRDFPFDLIHAHYLFPTVAASVSAAARTGVPLVASARGADVHTHPNRSAGFARETRRAIRGARRVLAVSRRLGEQVRALAEPSSPVEVVYNGVDAELFRPPEDRDRLRRELGLPATGVGVCTVTRLVADKGLIELLEAFARVAADDPTAWLVVVGEGPLRVRMENWIRAEGLADHVHLVGGRPHDEIPAWLGAADVFALPSYAEGLPNVVLEAMACAVPVVATDVGGVGEALVAGETGLLVRPRDAHSLRDALSRLVRDEPVRARMGRAARERVSARFTWPASARSLLRVYEDVLARDRGDRHAEGEGHRGSESPIEALRGVD